MAKKAVPSTSSSTTLKKLEEQLTCAICLHLYINPKTLPCLHSFCQQCLEGLPVNNQGHKYFISCPTCRRYTQLPRSTGAADFPTAFLINNLKEVYDQMAKVSRHQYFQKLEMSLKSVSDKVTAVINVLTSLKDRENEIKKQGELVKEEIHVMMAEMIDVLHQSERHLAREVDKVIGSKLRSLSEQKKSAERGLSQLTDCQEFVEQALKIGSPQVVKFQKQMMERMSHVIQQVKIEEFNPREKANIYFKKDNNIIDTLCNIGDIICLSPTVLRQCKVKEIDRQDINMNIKTVSFALSIQFSDSSPLSVPLSSLSCSVVPVGTTTPITTTVTTTTHPGVYIIHCSPVINGHHQVNVQVDNIQVDNTTVVIPFNPYLNNIIPVCTISELNWPWGVAVTNDGHIIVSEFGKHRVTVLERDGKKMKSFGQKSEGSENVKFHQPHGVAITQDNFLLVADIHKIQKISMDGKCVTSVGNQGSGPLEFDVPCGISISPITGHIYIADNYNHRIQVLNHDLTFSHAFGTNGSAEGQFNGPVDVAIDSQGLVYVTDTHNHRIQTFTPEGEFLSQFGTKGSSSGQLICPSGIVIDNNLMYITDNHRISIFTTNGQFIRSFGGYGGSVSHLNVPYGITLDREGYLYVCDRNNNRLVVY